MQEKTSSVFSVSERPSGYRVATKSSSVLRLTDEQKNAITEVTRITNSFAFESYKYFSTLKPQADLVICPLSIQIGLSLAYIAATGRTAEEIGSALHLPRDGDRLLQGHKFLVHFLKRLSPSLEIATKFYVETQARVKEEFQGKALNYFNSEVGKTDFHNDCNEAMKTINQWVKNKTKTEKNLLSDGDLNKETTLVIAAAVNFKNNWRNPFSVGATSPETFQINEKEKVQIEMMFKSDKYRYLDHPILNAQILELPLDSHEFTMIIVLPNEVNGLQRLEDTVSKINLTKELSTLKRCKVDVTLPKFEIDEKICYDQLLTSLGIKEIFDKNRARLKGISDENISVAKVVQSIFIQIDEHGNEAITAEDVNKAMCRRTLTSTDNDEEEAEAFFKANHPFLFIISQVISKEILVILIGKFTGNEKISQNNN